MERDFSLLYAELDLPQDCSLEEFNRAYRRRVAELHPDRQAGDPTSPESQIELAALISARVAVNRFHSRHGRMPGGAPHSMHGERHRPIKPASRSGLPVAVPASDRSERSAQPMWRFVIVFIALVLLAASLDWLAMGS